MTIDTSTIRIPPEVKLAGAKAAYARFQENSPTKIFDGIPWEEQDDKVHSMFLSEARAAIAAGLAAWPGAERERIGKGYEWPLEEEYIDQITLPLTQENTNEG